uniref:Uncharacterized protein n=1 Tax=Coccidioides posadasii RMSCC 3488 TaxID=454284 RepID=A0A0J6I3F1_COCPO|nr:hypothetical protein CPAG_02248 [Coccidioides posadasii RMSCC 3488]
MLRFQTQGYHLRLPSVEWRGHSSPGGANDEARTAWIRRACCWTSERRASRTRSGGRTCCRHPGAQAVGGKGGFCPPDLPRGHVRGAANFRALGRGVPGSQGVWGSRTLAARLATVWPTSAGE